MNLMDHELGYIDREELKKLDIPREVIRMIPRAVAESMGILPIGYGDDGALLVAACDPHNTSIKDEVQFYTGVREVRVYHGFRSAVMKAIEENYNRLADTMTSSSALDVGAAYLGTDNDMEAFPGVFGRSALEQFLLEDHKVKKGSGQGVSGALQDMALHDIIQVLAAARKSAVVTLEHGGVMGQVHLQEGRIINAYCGEKEGEEAFYEMVGWEDGTFKVDPDGELGPEAIKKSNDELILEGLRKLDESKASSGS